MKVLLHDGHVLTLPFTLGRRPEGSFDRLDEEGTAPKGVVSTIADSQLEELINKGAARDDAFATPTELMRDLRFIHRNLIDLSEGAEVGIEPTRNGYKLLIPDDARAPREPVKEGDRCAFNARTSPKVMLNAHGVVESVKGKKATVRLDEGDRQRIIRASGKEHPALIVASTDLIDKIS